VQFSANGPQKPQLLQHALRGHGFKSARLVPDRGRTVTGTTGPQAVPFRGAGRGASPSLRQMVYPLRRPSALLNQPHVFLAFHLSRSCTVTPNLVATKLQVSF